MDYLELARAYDKIEGSAKRLYKTKVIADLLKKTPEKDLEAVLLLLKGRVFPDYDSREIGMSSKLVLKSISVVTGFSDKELNDKWRDIGDLGRVAEELVGKKKQGTLFQEKLSVREVHKNLQKMPSLEGHGSVDQKVKLVANLLSSASGLEARYIVRTVLQELRVGVAEGTLRDAIAWAYIEGISVNYDDKKQSINPSNRETYNEVIDTLQSVIDKTNDFTYAASMAKQGISSLKKVKMHLGKPLKVMLAQKSEGVLDGFETVGKPAAIEYKLDGFRMQIHKDKDRVSIFTRRLEDVTGQFPEVQRFVNERVSAESCILDCEAVGFDPKTKEYKPFQHISQRIKRKYDIESLAEKLPVEVNVFDLLYLNGEEVIQKPFRERRELAESVIKNKERCLVLIKQIISDDEKEASKFYDESLKLGNEGVMFKNLDSKYKPGSRVGSMVKLKPSMDELDLVVTGAEWGKGKRSGWLTSFTVSCKKGSEFLEIGKVGTGLKEKKEEGLSFEELTELLKPLVEKQEGRDVKVEPKIVLSLRFEEIQRSPSYSSGFALRFPRVVALRDDKPLSEINTLDDVEEAFYGQ